MLSVSRGAGSVGRLSWDSAARTYCLHLLGIGEGDYRSFLKIQFSYILTTDEQMLQL